MSHRLVLLGRRPPLGRADPPEQAHHPSPPLLTGDHRCVGEVQFTAQKVPARPTKYRGCFLSLERRWPDMQDFYSVVFSGLGSLILNPHSYCGTSSARLRRSSRRGAKTWGTLPS